MKRKILYQDMSPIAREVREKASRAFFVLFVKILALAVAGLGIILCIASSIQ